MRRLWQMTVYRARVWLARRWCDPQLAWLAEQHGSVIVTAERFGRVLVPMYQVGGVGEFSARLAERLHDMTQQRDYWKRKAERHDDISSEQR